MNHPETWNETQLVSNLKYDVVLGMVKIVLILAELKVTGAGLPKAHPMQERVMKVASAGGHDFFLSCAVSNKNYYKHSNSTSTKLKKILHRLLDNS